MFKLQIKAASKKIIYKPLSISIKYLINEKKLSGSLNNLEKIFNIKLSSLQKRNFLSEDGTEIRISKPSGKPDAIIMSKVKIDKNFNSDFFRNHLAGKIKNLEGEELQNLHIFIPSYKPFKHYFENESYFYQTFVEGLMLGNYKFDKYMLSKKSLKKLIVLLYADNEKLLKDTINKVILLMEGVNFTRELQNEPANSLRPSDIAFKVKSKLREAGIRVTIFDEKELKKRKMGGLLAVGQGSSNKSRLIVLNYRPRTKSKGKKKIRKIALVGKGVTFDSGGISIKPANNMGEMKADMSGAALVAGSMLAVAKAKLPVEILGVIPVAENMLSGESMRPGDIVVTASGKSIEVDNTDAEGRIILADALDYTSKQKPDVIIDFATLTGACVVALGSVASGLFTKDDKLADAIYKSGMNTYDRVWRMPMWDDYNKLIESKVADVHNTGPRWAGAITAAKFLEHFVDEKIPWAHIDIAGPAFPSETNNYSKTYMTGYGVRLMFDYIAKVNKN